MTDFVTPYVICSRLMGGLGNQMFQYAFARSLALRTGAEVMLDISMLGKPYLGVTPRAYALSGFSINPRIATEDDNSLIRLERGVIPRLRRKIQRFLPVRFRRIIEDRVKGFDPSLLNAIPPVYLSGYWQSESYFKHHASTLKRDFHLRGPLSAAAQKVLAEIRLGPSVSVHVRRGDYLQNPHNLAFHGVQPAAYYLEAVDRLVREVGPLRPVVFSDDKSWVRENLELGRDTVFVELAGETSDREEMHLMSACDHHVISNSSFGWWGAWLGKNDDRRVVAPKRWFAATSVKSDIVPDSWVRI